jgi:hypothetical protein
MKNHWTYFEASLKSFMAFLETVTKYLSSARTSDEQVSFENYLEMCKAASAGQLNISALIANMAQ